jgi:hypothetical protein
VISFCLLLSLQLVAAGTGDGQSLPVESVGIRPDTTRPLRPDTTALPSLRGVEKGDTSASPHRPGAEKGIRSDSAAQAGKDTVPTKRAMTKDAPKTGTGLRTIKSGTAVLLSGLIPGGGQFYTGNPLKGILLGGAELALAGITVYEYRYSNGGQGNTDLGNTFLWWTGFAWAFSMADAYVSASMYGYKEEQRLDVRAGPTTVGIAYRF